MHAVEQQFVVHHVAQRTRGRAARSHREGAVGAGAIPVGSSDFRVVAIARKSQSSDEASWIEDSVRVEGGFEPAHQRERRLRRIHRKSLMPSRTSSCGTRRTRRMPTAAMRDLTPARDAFAATSCVSAKSGGRRLARHPCPRAREIPPPHCCEPGARIGGHTAICARSAIAVGILEVPQAFIGRECLCVADHVERCLP